MKEVEVKFERENLIGIVPIGTYLFDAAKRIGVKIENCRQEDNFDDYVFTVTKGKEILSETTKAEMEHLSQERRNKGERLARQAKIEKLGEISVMTAEPKAKPTPTEFETFVKDFEKLPLNEKVSKLLELEQITLGDTFNYILNLPYTIGEFVRDQMAEFGYKKEEEEKKAKQPNEHNTEKVAEENVEETKKKTVRKKPTVASEKKTATSEKKPTTTRKRVVKKTKTSEA
jgi:hypothetical protein